MLNTFNNHLSQGPGFGRSVVTHTSWYRGTDEEYQATLFLSSARRATSIQYCTPMVSASSLKS